MYKSKQGLKGVYNIDTQGFTLPLLVILGMGIIGGGIYFGRRAIKSSTQSKTYNKTLDDGTPENFALRLKQAMGNGYDGTDEAAILAVFAEIPNQDVFEKVEKAYQKLTQRNLSEALDDELSGYYLDKITLIKNVKAKDARSAPPDNSEQIAKAIHQGIQGTNWVSTDVELIFDSFKLIADRPTYEKVKTAYRNISGNELWEDLEKEWDLTTSWNGLTDFFTNPYAGNGGTYLNMLKKETIRRFSEL